MAGHDTYLGLRAFCEELARCGVTDACISPGSRSTPLALSLAAQAHVRTTSHLDERAGAFFALGLAKASGRVPVLACTSGTAAANYAPAVIEAHESRVPLLVLTADRPPELREVGAGQTIDQVKLYGHAAKWYLEIDDAPATPARVRWLRQLACRAVWTALADRRGPVHLNFSLREPLIPDGSIPGPGDVVAGRAGGRPWVTRPVLPHAPEKALLGAIKDELDRSERPLVVAGRAERGHPHLGEVLSEFAERARIPLLADPLSGARRTAAAIAHYDALLRDDAFAAAHRPDLVVRVGDLPTSKPLRALLHGDEDPLQIALDAEDAWQDPGAAVGTILTLDPTVMLRALTDRLGRRARDIGWLQDWHAADRAAAAAIGTTLAAAGLSEPRVAAELGTLLPYEATLVVASSMPVRDAETFFPSRPDPPRVLSNRGANGIDGTLSTAFGVAAATDGPVVCLIGDVALLHDVGGLAAATRVPGARVTIVLLDNDGGGIFSFLPVAGVTEPAGAVEALIDTPHGLDLRHAAALYGLGWEEATDVGEFRGALARALSADGSTIVRVKTDRAENVDLHRQVWTAVAGLRAA